MADPISDGMDNISQGFKAQAKKVGSLVGTLTKWGAIGGGLLIVGPAFAMQPELLTTLANNAGTVEATSTLTGSIAQNLGNLATYFGTGVANSGPVFKEYGEAVTTAWDTVAKWAGNVDFTPGSS